MASGLIPPAWFMTSAAPDVDALCVSFMSSRSEGRRIALVRAEAAEKIPELVGASSGPQGRPSLGPSSLNSSTTRYFQFTNFFLFFPSGLPGWYPRGFLKCIKDINLTCLLIRCRAVGA